MSAPELNLLALGLQAQRLGRPSFAELVQDKASEAITAWGGGCGFEEQRVYELLNDIYELATAEVKRETT